jgi:hypothetical protein
MLTARSVDATMSVNSTVARRLPEVLARGGMGGFFLRSGEDVHGAGGDQRDGEQRRD